MLGWVHILEMGSLPCFVGEGIFVALLPFFIKGSSDPDFRSLCSTVVARVMLGASIMCPESVCPLRFCVGSSVPGFRPLLYSAEMVGASIMCPGEFLFPLIFVWARPTRVFVHFCLLLSSSVFCVGVLIFHWLGKVVNF